MKDYGKTKKWMLFLTGLLLSLALLAGTALAAALSLNDGAKLLNATEQKAVSQALDRVEQKHNVRIAIVTANGLNGASAGKFANSLIDEVYKDGQKGNMVLVVDMNKHDWYISTDNNMRKMITDEAGINVISDKFVSHLSDKEFAQAFQAYASSADELLAYYEENGEPYDPADQFSFMALIIAIALAGLGAVGVRSSLRASMSNVAPSVTAADFLDEGSFVLQETEDFYLYTDRTAVPIKKESSRTSSSDSSHGGGGGKF